MNKYDERYEIRLAKIEDIDSIMEFIGAYWKNGHILSRNRELFEYEYVEGQEVHFVLAYERETSLLEGIFGYIPCSMKRERGRFDIWGSMWKVNDTHDNMALLGVELARRAPELTGCRYHIGNGANPNTTVPLRKIFFHEHTGRMKHYYFLNDEVEQYKIACIKNIWKPKDNCEASPAEARQIYNIGELRDVFSIESCHMTPQKDSGYFNRRYFLHPYYKYIVFALFGEKSEAEALMVLREVNVNNSKVLRIVDYIGEQKRFAGLYPVCHTMVAGYEYIDFYAYGFQEDAVLAAGFRERKEGDPNIIPNYFEPFEQKNVEIWVHHKKEGTLFFKADGDQDRPNQLPDKPKEEK